MCYRLLDVSCTLNFDLPSSVRENSSRVDRTARDGCGGRTFVVLPHLPSKFGEYKTGPLCGEHAV